ncbi:MAG: translation initiation factor IF-3 [Candidatus Pacebacteria bacterium]|nr:translation initiation factor IF-3 [Candidatus Paceibacterota bacterium]
MNKNLSIQKTPINHQIRAKEVRVIKEDGTQLGVMALGEAIKIARESNLDLIQVTDKVLPPVCKITDYGKYLYEQKKKEKSAKAKTSEIKGIRLSFGISDHDLRIRANAAKKFLEKGDKIRIEMRLKGRQKGLTDFAKEKAGKFIEILKELTPIKIEREIKIEPRGITSVISSEPKKNEAKN